MRSADLMTGGVLILVYLGLGVVFMIALGWQSATPAPVSLRIRRLLAWPFLLPVFAEAPSPPVRQRPARVAAILSGLALALPDPGARERQVLEGFLERITDGALRLEEIRRAQAQAIGPARGKLERLSEALDQELSRRLVLAEDLVGELTVLRFASSLGNARAEDELVRVERMLVDVEAMTDAWVSIEAG